MTEEIRLTRDIHKFIRGQLSWEESLRLLDEIVESYKWLKHLEMDMLIYHMACEKQELESSKPPVLKYY